jgi:hypothetical protein
MRRVVSDHSRVEPLGAGRFPQRPGERRRGNADLGGLFKVEIRPRIRMTTRYDQQMTELWLWFK